MTLGRLVAVATMCFMVVAESTPSFEPITAYSVHGVRLFLPPFVPWAAGASLAVSFNEHSLFNTTVHGSNCHLSQFSECEHQLPGILDYEQWGPHVTFLVPFWAFSETRQQEVRFWYQAPGDPEALESELMIDSLEVPGLRYIGDLSTTRAVYHDAAKTAGAPFADQADLWLWPWNRTKLYDEYLSPMVLKVQDHLSRIDQKEEKGKARAVKLVHQTLDRIMRDTNFGFAQFFGNSGQLSHQTDFFLKLVAKLQPETVCEVGFNAGHSLADWIMGSDSVKHVYALDINAVPYTGVCLAFLDLLFPDRLRPTMGHSSFVIGITAEKNPDVRCDLAHVDGWHSDDIPWLDLVRISQLSHHSDDPRTTSVVMDDMVILSVRRGWDDLLQAEVLLNNTCTSFDLEQLVSACERSVCVAQFDHARASQYRTDPNIQRRLDRAVHISLTPFDDLQKNPASKFILPLWQMQTERKGDVALSPWPASKLFTYELLEGTQGLGYQAMEKRWAQISEEL